MRRIDEKARRVFSRFSPFIREYIYHSGWNELRRVQIEAADLIFHSQSNLLISSQTASGKTEAALFPILSLMNEESPGNFTVLYISPLKSLINDQFSRMEEILRESGLPVFRWHGDVSRSHKEAFLKKPGGLLQITPESLESMLCKRSHEISRLFTNLKFVILDEIHSVMGTDRGNQILCQLERIAKQISYSPRRIALSATLGNADGVAAWLGGGSGRATAVIQIPAQSVSWRLALEHFFISDQDPATVLNAATELIFKATRGDHCVVFANSREETEEITASLRNLSKKKQEEDRFFIHHGNLSASIREEAEFALKSSERTATVCATASLELGIDVGNLKRIIQLGAPPSVSSFLQRLGRSGRRSEAPEMLMVFREEEPLSLAPIYQMIPWDLLQAIAIIELYRIERFIEPAGEKKLPASLLFHQTLSHLSAKGSLPASHLAKEILSLSPFAAFSKEMYRDLLLHMLKHDYLERTEENELIIGIKGEKLLSAYHFFSVFKDREDFTVRSDSEEIGTITAAPPIGERFALAGRVWEVVELDVSRRTIFAKPIEGKMKVSWPGEYGVIHTRILEQMRSVLLSEEEYPYLLENARERLKNARRIANQTEICKQSIVPLGGNRYAFFPWLGTKGFETLKRVLQKTLASSLHLIDIQSYGCYCITYKSEKATPSDVINALIQLNEKGDFPLASLVLKTEYPIYDKFDPCLPHDLLLTCFAENRLDWCDVQNRILSWKKI